MVRRAGDSRLVLEEINERVQGKHDDLMYEDSDDENSQRAAS